MKNILLRMLSALVLSIVILSMPHSVLAQAIGANIGISTPPPCRSLDTDLRFGQGKTSATGLTGTNSDTRNAIMMLQNFLYSQQLFNFQSSGYFGSLTLAGVKKFQSKNGIPATGFVGTLTRAKINAIVGCGGWETGFPVIFNAKGPSALDVGMRGTWTIEASDRKAGNLTYSVSWGDEQPITVNAGLANASQAVPVFVQTSTFSHTYASEGTYAIRFTVRNETTKSVTQKTVMVTVTDPNKMRVTVVSPNGGEKWNIRSNQAILWNVDAAHANASSAVDLYLIAELSGYKCEGPNPCPAMAMPMPYVLDRGIAANATYYWIAGTDISDRPIPTGTYRMRVCAAGANGNCDESDKAFTLVDLMSERTADLQQAR